MKGMLRCHMVLALVGVWAWSQARAQGPKTLVINEILANNTKIVLDANKKPVTEDDWIEIYNASDKAVDMGGMYLTDDLKVPTKWQIPVGSLVTGRGYRLIWAGNHTSAGGQHASFSLQSDGEEIGLFDKDGSTVIDTVSFGRQDPNTSYGRYPDGASEWRLFGTPTGGTRNLNPYLGVVADPQFSRDRGFYDEPFSVAITTATADAMIFYTLDGSSPLESRGGTSQLYVEPISITTTTCLRAAAIKDGFKPSHVQTCTYLFAQDVASQPRNPSGFPTYWAGTAADYAMDPDITSAAAYSPLVEDALASLPTLSIVMATADLFGSNGIYANPSSRGAAWERPTSAELIYPDGLPGFQIDCGIQIQGGWFRPLSSTPKKSLRLSFKGLYGPAKLRYPLFGDDAVSEFDTVTLRAGANDGYAWDGARYTEQYIRDQFGRDLQRATGNVGSHGTFVHVYLNGLYWGLYNIVERPDAAFSASYLGGDKEDWDALHNGGSTEPIQGDLTAWNQMIAQCKLAADSDDEFQMLQGRNPDGTPNPAFPDLLDVPNYIDYLIVNLWGGNWDWPWKNWYAARDRMARSTGFKFYCWDFENTLGNNLSRSPLNKNALQNDFSSAGEPHQNLKRNAEYRLLFADHVHRFLFNGGVLAPESLVPRYESLAAGVELAIVTESARWGDQHFHPPLTLEDWYDRDTNYNDGRAGRDWVLKYYLPQRTAIVLQQFKDAGLYPKVDAPVFRINGSYQHGGQTASNALLSMTAPAGKIYYTLDRSDPRTPATAVAADSGMVLAAQDAAKRVLVPTAAVSDAWRGGAAFDDAAWALVSGSPGGVGYDRNPTGGGDYRPFISLNVESQMYGTGKGSSCYIRIPFTLQAAQLDQIGSLTLKMLYDDGFVAYLNGSEAVRATFTGTPAWNSKASGSRAAGTTFTAFDLSGLMGELQAGDNILAIHGANSSSSSDDFLMVAELTASKTSTSAISGVSPGAAEYRGAVTLTQSVHVKSRVLSGTTWSALNEASFAVGPVATSLRISEIQYHPQDTGDPGDPNTEFIELKNTGTQAINLNLVRFTKGIDFTFGDVVLQPGRFTLVVRDAAAFAARYGAGLPVAGVFAGSLDNAGERIRLEDAAGTAIHDFKYSDGWYDATDGGGYSLTVKDPAAIGNDPAALGNKDLWRAGAKLGGSPGA
jgi:hypothetical protein